MPIHSVQTGEFYPLPVLFISDCGGRGWIGRHVPDDPGGLTGSQLISASDMFWPRANRSLSKPTAAF